MQVLSSGTKSFQIEKYSPVTKRNILKTLGKFGKIKYSEAKQKAKELSAKIADGEDLRKKTIKEKKAQLSKANQGSITVAELSKKYIQKYRKDDGSLKKSIDQDQMYFDKAINPEIGSLKLREVTKFDIIRVRDRYDKDGHRISGNRCLTVLSGAMNWAVEKGDISENPCRGVKKLVKHEKVRERVLEEKEISRLWIALNGNVSAKLIKFLIITGQRSGEVRNMLWSEVKTLAGMTVWEIPGEKTKNGDTNIVPLPQIALELLDSLDTETEFVFQGPKGSYGRTACRQKFNKLTRSWDWDSTTLHDLRRTFRTYLANLGVYDEIAEGLLNHRVGRMQRTYNHSLRLTQKREAMELWGNELTKIISTRLACGCQVASDDIDLEKIKETTESFFTQ